MPDDISKTISQMLLAGQTKKAIYRKLKESEDPVQLVYMLNNEAELSERKKYQFVCLGAAFLLVWLTAIKVYDAVSLGSFNIYWLATLVVPMIHIYILRKMLRFHRMGYLFMCILGLLGLLRPENQRLPELPITLLLIGVSGFLYFYMYPKRKMLAQETPVPPETTT